MKNIVRFLSFALALVMLVAVFAACGKKDEGATAGTDVNANADTKAAEVAGEKQTWGIYSVLVPSDMTLAGGDLIDKESPEKFSLSLKENESHQIRVSVVDEETATSSVATTKEMNESSDPKDVEFKAGDVTWKGVAYNYMGTSDCFQIYGEINGRCVLVGGSYYAYDSDVTNAILASLEVTAAESAAE